MYPAPPIEAEALLLFFRPKWYGGAETKHVGEEGGSALARRRLQITALELNHMPEMIIFMFVTRKTTLTDLEGFLMKASAKEEGNFYEKSRRRRIMPGPRNVH